MEEIEFSTSVNLLFETHCCLSFHNNKNNKSKIKKKYCQLTEKDGRTKE